MNKDSIMRKVRKAMALSASSNEYEAQRALAQAQKLMAAHGLTQAELDMVEIVESDFIDPDTVTIVAWHRILAHRISRVFGIRVYSQRVKALPAPGRIDNARRASVLKFFGPAHRVAAAEHAFTVLRRRIESERKSYVKSLQIAGGRRQAGTAFAAGFASNIADACQHMTLSDSEQTSMTAWMRDKGLTMHRHKPKSYNASHFNNGSAVAKETRPLDNPVDGAAALKQIGA